MCIKTDLFPFLRQPLFIRENQYDTAKLGNCGWAGDAGDFALKMMNFALTTITIVSKTRNFVLKRMDFAEYLKLWGAWMRAQLAVIRESPKDGYFSGACLEHGGNFGFDVSPVLRVAT